jgi:hypothetical protein
VALGIILEVLFRRRLVLNIFPFPVSKAKLAVTHPLPFLIILLKWHQEYSYPVVGVKAMKTSLYF